MSITILNITRLQMTSMYFQKPSNLPYYILLSIKWLVHRTMGNIQLTNDRKLPVLYFSFVMECIGEKTGKFYALNQALYRIHALHPREVCWHCRYKPFSITPPGLLKRECFETNTTKTSLPLRR